MSYLRTFALSFILIIGLCVGLNWFIDPFGMYWSPNIQGFNQVKPEAGKRSRIAKVYRARQVSPEILIVGNSRVEMGIDPSHSAFAGKAVYNQGIPGAGLRTQFDYARNVIAESPTLHTLIIGVDLLDFLTKKEWLVNTARVKNSPEYWPRLQGLSEANLSNSLFRFKEQAAMLFSLDAMEASVATLFSQGALKNSINNRGLNTADTYLSILHHEGIAPLYIQKIQELHKRLRNRELSILTEDKALRPFLPLSQLEAFLREISEHNIEVYLFINPYHYSYVQLLDELDYREEFLSWKRELVKVVAKAPNQGIQLWDFSGFNDYILEPVPLSSKQQEMDWYWEPAHYKKELGDLVINRMLTTASEPSDFGVQLKPGNIDQLVKQDKQALQSSAQQWAELKSALELTLN